MNSAIEQHPRSAPAVTKKTKTHVFASIGLVFAIIFAAWLVSGREGLSQLGHGGVNEKLLPRAGDAAPDVTITDVFGNSVALSSLQGKTVWLNFWGSWCAPCRSEMPDIITAYQQVKDKDVVLLAVSLDEDPREAAIFAAQNNANFDIYTDQYRSATNAAYPIHNFPTHIFIDKTGIVRHVVLSEMTVSDAVQYVDETINAV